MVYGISLTRLLADRCPGCDATTENGFCGGCRMDFMRIANACPRCGLDLPAAECPRARVAWAVDGVIAPYGYVEPLRHYIQGLKFGGQRRLGRALGELLKDAIATAPSTPRCDAIIAVPLHRRRLRERGYNQAFELARPIAAALGVPLLRNRIVRRRATGAQSRLSARDRYANLRGAFHVTRDLRDLHLGIVDDVLTTGATLNALAAALKAAGAVRVYGWTVARSL